jgi:hypothetical protein
MNGLDLGTQAVSFLFGALLASTTGWLTRRQFYSQRWWKQRSPIYNQIIEHLVTTQELSQKWVMNEFIANVPGAPQLTEEDTRERSERMTEARRAIRHQVKLQQFHLSPRASKLLERYLRQTRDVDYDTGYNAAIERIATLHLTEFTELARRDLHDIGWTKWAVRLARRRAAMWLTTSRANLGRWLEKHRRWKIARAVYRPVSEGQRMRYWL